MPCPHSTTSLYFVNYQGLTLTHTDAYVGNRTNLLEVYGTSSVLTAYSYGSANRLLASVSSIESNEYAYDGAGRLTNQIINPATGGPSGQPRQYEYSFRGQMTELADMDGRVFRYDFDGDGNRISQSLNECLESRFVYDGPNVVLDFNATGQVTEAYVYFPGIDQPIERMSFINEELRSRHIYHLNGLGSVAALTDDAGTTVKTYTYEAVGAIRAEMQTLLVNRITYTAREAIGDSLGLHFLRNRVFDPITGRFTSRDPLGFVDGPNLYGYVGNNPILFVDPLGLSYGNPVPPIVIGPVDPPWNVPPGKPCDVYGGGILGFFCNAFGEGCWANCVRGCLQDDWDPCKKKYNSGLVGSHARCFERCAQECLSVPL